MFGDEKAFENQKHDCVTLIAECPQLFSTHEDNEMHLAYVSVVALGSNSAVPQQLQQKLEPPPTSYSTTPAPPHLYMTKSNTVPLLLPHPLSTPS